MKKTVSIVILIFMIMQSLTMVSFAEDVHEFPPQRPEVGNMKLALSDKYADIICALRTDGTINIRAKEINSFAEGLDDEVRNELLAQTDVVDVACTNNAVVLLKSDGTLFLGQCPPDKMIHGFIDRPFEKAAEWTDIVAIDCGLNHLVALKSDGTVIATGDNKYSQCDVEGWTNVSKIYARNDATLAIRKDGTIIATGNVKNYRDDLSKQKNVKDLIYYSREENIWNVLYNDGTVDAFPLYYEGKRYDLDELFAELTDGGKIEKIVMGINDSFWILDTEKNLYYMKYSAIEKISEDVVFLDDMFYQYYAIDANGMIWSDTIALTSSNWILTTNLTYNGEKIYSDVPPYIKDGRTLAPVRAILEALGMEVGWNAETRTVIATKGETTISVSIDSDIAYVNGVEKKLDVPAEITNGRTFVPVRFFAESLDMNVEWDAMTKTVIIESK